MAFQLRFERSAEIHSGEVERVRVSSAQAKSWPKVVWPALCDEASAAMQEHGFWKAKQFCEISVSKLLLTNKKIIPIFSE
ncbi:hypothetical protein CXF70_14815 [Planomicrobium sp. MB-3u-38]|nr:hypothetical protein CXF70_14815 [Planomicrobium sp. MB-3u-38]